MIYKINITSQILWFVSIIILHLLLLNNFKFTLWPEIVVYPYLLNNGFSLYKDIINPYPPIFPLSLAIFSNVFGYLPKPYEILTWIIIIITDFLIYKASYKLTKSIKLAGLSLIFFIFFSIPFGINGLWFDLVQMPLILGSFYFFYEYFELKKISGLTKSFILAISAFFIKQQVFLFIIWIIILLMLSKKISSSKVVKALIPVFAFAALLIILHVSIFYKLGNLNDFINWTVIFPFAKASQMPGYVSFPSLRQLAIIISLFVLFTPLVFSEAKNNLKIAVFTAIVITSFAYPRFDYFHLIPSLTLLSLVFGQNVYLLFKSSRLIKLVTIIMLVNLLIFSFRSYSREFKQETRFFESEILSAARTLSLYTSKQDLVYIQNGPDQLLPLAQRIPLKPWADEFPWYLEVANVQVKIIESLKTSKPNFIVYQAYSEGQKYDLGVYKPEDLANYLDKNYEDYSKISGNLTLKRKK